MNNPPYFVQITSPHNGNLKLVKKLQTKKYRRQEGKILLEGMQLISDILDLDVLELIFIEESHVEKSKELLFSNRAIKFPIFTLEHHLFSEISDVVTSQGIIAVGKNPIRPYTYEKIQGKYIYLDGLQDPGNVGGIIRSALAFSFDGIFLGKNTVDPTNPKVVRSTMSGIYKIPIYELEDKLLKKIVNHNFPLYVLDAGGDMNFKHIFKEDFMIAVGNEGNGPREEIRGLSEGILSIPMDDNIESLNANVAASIAMYELGGLRHE